jgi:alpha-galactosidase
MEKPVAEAHYSANEIAAADLDHEAWREALPVPINRYWSGVAAPAARHAEARLLWTNEAICVRFVCQQQEPLIINSMPQTKTKTLGLWERDVCELFLSPDLDEVHRYFEFEAAPTAEWVDLAVTTTSEGRETQWEFTSGMTAAARVSSSDVVIAIRVPWTERIPRPNNGTLWGLNLCRCVGAGVERGYLAWQPTFTSVANFHVPAAFGRLLLKGKT